MRTRTMKARMLSLALSLLMMVILLGNSLLAYAGAEGLSDVRAESIEKATSSDARREEVSSVEIEEDANTLREEIIEDIVTATDSEADKMDVIDGEVLELPETLAFRTRAAIPNNDMDLDADSLYYAKDKGEYLSVVDAETKEVVEEWAFCIQSNYGTPSYYGGDSHIGEYKLLEEYDADALYQELREASPKADSETCFVRIRNAMYLFASDPTKIQERYSLPRFTFYTLTQDEIYGWSNGQRKTKYGVQNWNDARSEIETLILKDDLIPSNVAVEMRIYDAQRRIGHSVQSLATLRIAEEIVPELPEDKASLRTSVSIDGRSASDKEALQEEAGSNKTVVDTISYKGLVPGKEYTLTGSLMKIEGEHAVQVGKSVSKRFTPAKEEGTESISFTNVTLEAGVTYVVYEEAESTEELTFATGTKKHRIEHKDKDDKAQTVVVEKPDTPPVGGEKPNLPSKGGGDSHTPGSANVTLTAIKTVDGLIPNGDSFTFLLKDENGQTLQAKNNEGGNITFDSIAFNQTGTFIYYITEQPGEDRGVNYDTASYKVLVTVTREYDYTASVVYEKEGQPYDGTPAFANTTTPVLERVGGFRLDIVPKTEDTSGIEIWAMLAALSFLSPCSLYLCGNRKKGQYKGKRGNR